MFCLLPVLLTSLVLSGPPVGPDPAGPGTSRLPSRGMARATRDAVELLTAPDRRVRAIDRTVQRLLEDGLRRSSTFSSLLSDLDRTDVIVYVEQVRDLPAVIAGRLLLVPGQGHQRYLRIQLGTGGTLEDAIATLAHELQHALEVAAFPEVRDVDALARLYERIGYAGPGLHMYDTAAAQEAGRKVKRELG